MFLASRTLRSTWARTWGTTLRPSPRTADARLRRLGATGWPTGFADCTPVVLTAPGGFAVVHSGWRGTLARISGKAACVLARETGSSPEEVSAYVGPHILGSEYEVSDELLHTFCLQFANMNITRPARLDMSAAVRTSLEESGVPPCAIHDEQLSTMSRNDRFFSYRAENGVCGRHGAIAYMPSARS